MPGTIYDLLPLRVSIDAAEIRGSAHVKILPKDKLVEMNVGIYSPTEKAYVSDGRYSIGGQTGTPFAKLIGSGYYLVLYKIDGWESTPRARGSTLENVRSIRPCFVSISAREYQALRDILSNPTQENIERARKRIETILNEILLTPNPQRSVLSFGRLFFNKSPQKSYADMLADFLSPEKPKPREVVPAKH